ncbi:IPExxxVDY family protein [Roseivirga sp.]|uniref:IPExxxVDY family protein n=1 Tax=Roseivirga sp. TaxID=1964215 RepID=UPI003B8B428F
MAKNKLEITYDYDLPLMALNANVKPYKLAWSINQEMGLALTKKKNLDIGFTGGKVLSIVNYDDINEFRIIRLLRNRAEESEVQFDAFIVPEMKNFDYFIILENESQTLDENAFFTKIKQIPFVQFATKVDIKSLKSRDNLIF